MPQVPRSTRDKNRTAGSASNGNPPQQRRQSQCPSEDSAYGSGLGEDELDVQSARYRRADGTLQKVVLPARNASAESGPAKTSGYFPKAHAYWSDGVDADTRAASIANQNTNVRFKNYTPEHMVSRQEPKRKPQRDSDAETAWRIVAAHEAEIRRLMEVASDLEYRLRMIERQDLSR